MNGVPSDLKGFSGNFPDPKTNRTDHPSIHIFIQQEHREVEGHQEKGADHGHPDHPLGQRLALKRERESIFRQQVGCRSSHFFVMSYHFIFENVENKP